MFAAFSAKVAVPPGLTTAFFFFRVSLKVAALTVAATPVWAAAPAWLLAVTTQAYLPAALAVKVAAVAPVIGLALLVHW